MENNKENLFSEKFRLLNSQDHIEDINWSSSCSSDYEDTANYKFNKRTIYETRAKKRKRKKKAPNNICNLRITTLDASSKSKNDNCEEKSPILIRKVCRKSASLSPVLKSSIPLPKANSVVSPILPSRTVQIKSPVILLKTESPKSTVKVKKKLFEDHNIIENLEKSKNQTININQKACTDKYIKNDPDEHTEIQISTSPSIEFEELPVGSTCSQLMNTNSSQAKLKLVERVKSFFDSHFSTQNSSVASQNSISDVVTPKNSTKTSDEEEILTCKSQSQPNSNSMQLLKEENSANSSESSLYNFNKNSKKIRYKKDGHAYRLNNLLKKQNASVALWQHERFMAANSNFVIPNGEYSVFRIQNVNFKYGCHLIDAVDVHGMKFLILINSCYALGSVGETVLKVYEPYKVLQYDSDCKLIIHVTKFECNNYES